MATNRRRRTRAMRPILTEEQLQYPRDGDYGKDVEVFLWSHPTNREEVRAAFEAIRSDYPAGAFPWAEKEFGK